MRNLEYYKEVEEYKRKRALKMLLKKENISFEIEDFKWFVQIFCLIKTWICLKLKRTKGSYMDLNKFCILAYDERSCMDSLSWDGCWVSPYLFKDWNVCLASDGT